MSQTVLISDPAGFNTQRIPVNGVSWSTAIGQSGTLSAEVRSSDLVAYGLNGNDIKQALLDALNSDNMVGTIRLTSNRN